MAQATISLDDGAPSELAAVVGARSYDRGLEYARRGRVLRLGWDSEAEALTGAVVGQGGLYETAAFFGPGPDGMLVFEDGRCTCPVGVNCKHVAAIVLTASQRRIARPTTEPRRPSWEQPLRALIEQPAAAAVGEPLAVELALVAPHGAAPRLDARLLRPGARGGWVNGSLTWALDGWHIRNDELRKDHLALAHELHALQRAGVSQATYWYGYRGDKTIDLSGCGPHLWLVLDEAARLGLALVSADRVHGELPRYVHGEVVLDVSSPDETGLLVRALLQADGHELEPVLFLGKEGHGVVCVEPGTDSLRLVRLSQRGAAEAPAPRARCGVAGDSATRRLPLRRGAVAGARAARAGRVLGRVVRAAGGLAAIALPARPLRPGSCGRDRVGLVVPGRGNRAQHTARIAGGGPGLPRPSRRTGAPRGARSHGNGARGLRPARRLRTPGRKWTGSVGRDRDHALHLRAAPAPARRGRDRGRGRGRAAGLPRRRRVTGDRHLDLRGHRRARLVRPRRLDHGRWPQRAVRRGLHGARSRRVALAARRRRTLLASRSALAIPAPADRGGRRRSRMRLPPRRGSAATRRRSGRSWSPSAS